ncbi:MAG TPA: 3'(2'),5'-bisphosphate nucleotidase CysQ [Rhizomicrobium sp.]|nr:3'(2'),5'-bisphosphate nucleotidase CysQ [Rhizomicrobium sp.]
MPAHDRQAPEQDGSTLSAAPSHAPKANKDLEKDLTLLESRVRAAGKIALNYFGGSYKRWSKEGGSPVTEADLAIDSFLKTELLQARSDYGWLSEESVDDPARLTRLRTFVVDPIDGTVAFMKGRPHFTICAGIVEAGRAVAGVVFNPARDECFIAASGQGARLNGETIGVGHASEIEGIRLLGDRKLFAEWPPMQIESLSSIAYRIVLVAAGRFDAMISLTVKRDWDMAAADIILAEAGGKLVGGDGLPLRYNNAQAIQGATIAAGPELIGPLLAQLAAKNSLKNAAKSL